MGRLNFLMIDIQEKNFYNGLSLSILKCVESAIDTCNKKISLRANALENIKQKVPICVTRLL